MLLLFTVLAQTIQLKQMALNMHTVVVFQAVDQRFQPAGWKTSYLYNYYFGILCDYRFAALQN